MMRTHSRKRNAIRAALWMLVVAAMCLNAVPWTMLAEGGSAGGSSSGRRLSGEGTLWADDTGALNWRDDAGSFAPDGTALFVEDEYVLHLDASLAGKDIRLPAISGGSLTIRADEEIEVAIHTADSPVTLASLCVEGNARVNLMSTRDIGLSTRALSLSDNARLSVDAKMAAVALFADGDMDEDSVEGTVQLSDGAQLSLKAETGIVAVGQGLLYGTGEGHIQFEGRSFSGDANPVTVVLDDRSGTELAERFDEGASVAVSFDMQNHSPIALNPVSARDTRRSNRGFISALRERLEREACGAFSYAAFDAEGDAVAIGEDFSGSGRFYDDAGQLLYEGDVVNGAFEGQGVFYERDGRPKAQGVYANNAIQSGIIHYTNCEGNRAQQAIEADGSANAVKAQDRQFCLGDEASLHQMLSVTAVNDSVLTLTNALFFREHEIKRTYQNPQDSASVSGIDCTTEEPGVVGDVAMASGDQGNSPTYHFSIVTENEAPSEDAKTVAFTVRHVDGNGREVAPKDGGRGEAGEQINAKDYALDFGEGFVWSADADPLELSEDLDENVMTITYTGSGEPVDYTIRHVNGDGDEVAPDDEGNGVVGDFVFAGDCAVDIGPGISWSADVDPLPLTRDGDKNIMMITYTGTGEPVDYTIHHVNGNGDEVAPDDEKTGAVGEFIFAASVVIDFGPGINWSADFDPLPITEDAEQNVMTITYRGTGDPVDYTIRHVGENGERIMEDDQGQGAVGGFISAADFARPPVGYQWSPDVSSLMLTSNPALNVITITYTHDGGEIQYTIRYQDIAGGDVLYMDGGTMQSLAARKENAKPGDVIRARDEVDRVAGKTVGYEYVDALIGLPSDKKVASEMTLPYGNNEMTLRYRKSNRTLLIIEGYTTPQMYAEYRKNGPNDGEIKSFLDVEDGYTRIVESAYAYVNPGEKLTRKALFDRLGIAKYGFELANAASVGDEAYAVTDEPVQLVRLSCDYNDALETKYYIDVDYTLHAYDNDTPIEWDEEITGHKGKLIVMEGTRIDIEAIKWYFSDYYRILDAGYQLDEERTIRENNLPRRFYDGMGATLKLSFTRNKMVKLAFSISDPSEKENPVEWVSEISLPEGVIIHDISSKKYEGSGGKTIGEYVQENVDRSINGYTARLYGESMGTVITSEQNGYHTLYGEMSADTIYRVGVIYIARIKADFTYGFEATSVYVEEGFGKTQAEWDVLASELKKNHSLPGVEYDRCTVQLESIPNGVDREGVWLTLYYTPNTELLGYQYQLVDAVTEKPIQGLPLIPVGKEDKFPKNWWIDGFFMYKYIGEYYEKLIDLGYYVSFGNPKNAREEELLTDGQIYKLYCDRATVKYEVTFLTEGGKDQPILKLTGREAWGTPVAEIINDALRGNSKLKGYSLTGALPTAELVYEESPGGPTNAFLVYVEPTSQLAISAHTVGDGAPEDIAP